RRGNTLLEVEDIVRIILALDFPEPVRIAAIIGAEPVANAAIGNVNVGAHDIGLQRLAKSLDPDEISFLLTAFLPYRLPFHIEFRLSMEERCGPAWYPTHCTTPAKAPDIARGIGSVCQEFVHDFDSFWWKGTIGPG